MSASNNQSSPKKTTRRAKPKSELAAVAEVPIAPEAPPLEAEPLHQALARCNATQAKLTDELRTLKSEWAAENIRSQQARTPIPTSKLTHVETRRRELHLELQKIQAELGRLNKAARQAGNSKRNDKIDKAERQGNGTRASKRGPLLNDPEYPQYFLLAAKDELAPTLFSQVERTAKAMLADAKRMGVSG
jgi:hypothetical protein